MFTLAARYGIHVIFISLVSLLMVLAMNPELITNVLPNVEQGSLQNFKMVWISIILEAMPFILLGVFVSSIMQVFVSDEMVRRFVPKNPILGIAFGSLLGVLFPICECGMIPIVRRLIQKGMPTYIGVIFIIVGPIFNPVVYTATYLAFRTRPEIVYTRMGLALIVGAVIGYILYKVVRESPLRHSVNTLYNDTSMSNHTHTRPGGRFSAILEHAAGESFDMGKYLMFGAAVTALVQTFVSRESLAQIGQNEWSSSLFMMGFAYILSICSTSDAFVAASFGTTFPGTALLAFLVFGPMLDFKSTLMLLSVFRAKFVLLLSVLIAVTVLVGAVIIGSIFL